MKLITRLALTGAAIIVTATALAQSPVGTWKGKLDVSQAKATTESEKQQLSMVKSFAAGISFKLSFKKDKTYSMTMTGGPAGAPAQAGKWTQSGRTIMVTGDKGKPQKMTISANGKMLTMLPPADDKGPKGIKLVFKKG
jgi:hypothetical protein